MYKPEPSEFTDKLSIVYHFYCALNEEDLDDFTHEQLIAFAKAKDQLNPFKLNGLNLAIHEKLVQRSANNLQKFMNRFPNFKLDLKRFENSFHKAEHEKQFRATPQENNLGVCNIESYEDIVNSEKQASKKAGVNEKAGQSANRSQSKVTAQIKPYESDGKSTQMKAEQSGTENTEAKIQVEEGQQATELQEDNKPAKKKVDWNQTSSEQGSFLKEDQEEKQTDLKDSKPIDDSIDSFEDDQQLNSQSFGKGATQGNKTGTKNEQSQNRNLSQNEPSQEKQLKSKINSVITGYSSNQVKHHYRYADQPKHQQQKDQIRNNHSQNENNVSTQNPAMQNQKHNSFEQQDDKSSEASYDIEDQNLRQTEQNSILSPSHCQEQDEDDVDFEEKLKRVKQMHKINFQTHKKTYETLRNRWNRPKDPNPASNQNHSDSESLSDSDSFHEKQKRFANRQFR